MKQSLINPLSKLYVNVVVYIFFLLSPLVFGQQTLDIDQEQNKKIEALEKKIEELEEMMVGKNLSGDIVAKSLTIKGDGGNVFISDGFVLTANSDNKKTSYLGTGENNIGFLQIFNSDGNDVAYFGSSLSGDGLVSMNDKSGKAMVSISKDNDDDGDVVIDVYHPSGETAARFGAFNEDGKEVSILFLKSNEDHGVGLIAQESGSQMNMYYNDKKIVILGAANEGIGMLVLNNTDAKNLVYLGPSEGDDGMLTIYNKNANQIAYLGPTRSNHGLIILKNRYGEAKWTQSGER